jgi:ABC-type Fe3+ transport system substrate-binding protein
MGHIASIIRRAAALVLAAFAMGGAASADDRVVVLTSYAEELTHRYAVAFERAHPGKRVEILWRHSADALAYLEREKGEVDVYWTPAQGNFAILRAANRFRKLELDHGVLPPRIGGQWISAPDGTYAAFELAGHGIVYNKNTIEKLGIAPPADWIDLAGPAYAGKVQIPIPGRVGFAPVLIESVLQGYGWDEGWAALAGIAANADFGAVSDNVPAADSVVSGEKAARMTIDFFAATAIANGAPLGFRYPEKTTYSPAHVAILTDAPHPENARAFVDFVLSPAGQTLLFDADVRRLPARADLYASKPELPARPFAGTSTGYDEPLGRERRGLVAALFKVFLVDRHPELAESWARLHRLETAGKTSAELELARAILSAAPISATQQADAELRKTFAFPARDPLPLAESSNRRASTHDEGRRDHDGADSAAATMPGHGHHRDDRNENPHPQGLKHSIENRWAGIIDERIRLARALLQRAEEQ